MGHWHGVLAGKPGGGKALSEATRIVIVGGGPGGYVAGIRAAQRGAQVTVVEKDLVGGTCLNRGCVPTKAILGSVEAIHKARAGEEFGFKVGGDIEPDFARIMERKNEISKKLRDGIQGLFKRSKVELLVGQGRIVSADRVEVETTDGVKSLAADKIIIATGSEPAELPFFDFSQPTVLDSTAALEMEQVPKSLLIIGAGVIGCEFTSIFSELGTDITMVEMMPQMLPLEDKRLAKQFQSIFRKKGINVMLKSKVESVADYGDNSITVDLEVGIRLLQRRCWFPSDADRIPRTSVLRTLGWRWISVDTSRSMIGWRHPWRASTPSAMSTAASCLPMLLLLKDWWLWRTASVAMRNV